MRKTLAGLILAFFAMAAGKAYCSGGVETDWEGSVSVTIKIRVLCSTSGEPIPNATVRLSAPEESYQQPQGQVVHDEKMTDAAGYALFNVEFVAQGFTKSDAGWRLSGKVEIEKDGHLRVSDRIVHYTGRSSYPIQTDSIDVEARLYPATAGSPDVPVPLLPIGFNPDILSYVFRGDLYGSDFGLNGYPSLVNAIEAAGEMDAKLEQYVVDYKRKIAVRRGFLWPGLVLLFGGFITEIYPLTRENPTATEVRWGLVGAGISIAGGVMCWVGLTPGKPTELVEYYNSTYRR
jgi:hypothetical protein